MSSNILIFPLLVFSIPNARLIVVLLSLCYGSDVRHLQNLLGDFSCLSPMYWLSIPSVIDLFKIILNPEPLFPSLRLEGKANAQSKMLLNKIWNIRSSFQLHSHSLQENKKISNPWTRPVPTLMFRRVVYVSQPIYTKREKHIMLFCFQGGWVINDLP